MSENHPYKSFRYLLGLSLNGALGGFLYGYELGSTSAITTILSEQLEWNRNCTMNKINISLLASLLGIGAVIGGAISGYMAAKFGRRKSLVYSSMVAIIGVILTLFRNTEILFAGRGIIGISIGIEISLVSVYIEEYSPLIIKAKLKSFIVIFISLGLLISYIMALGIPSVTDPELYTSDWWRYIYGLPLIILVFRLIIFLCVYTQETPIYIYIKGQQEKAKELLRKIYKEDYIETEMENLRKNQESQANSVQFRQLLSKKYIKPLSVGIILFAVQELCGINSLLAYASNIYERTQGSNTFQCENEPQKTENENTNKILSPFLFSFLLGLETLIASIAVPFFVEKINRRTLILTGCLGCGVTIGLIATFILLQMRILVFVLIYIYLGFFGTCLYVAPFIYLPEILPDAGQSIVNFGTWISHLFVVFLFPILSDPDVFNIYGVFYMYSAITLFSFIFLYFFAVETKGKTKTQIQIEYQQHLNTHNHTNITNHKQVIGELVQHSLPSTIVRV